MRRRMTSVAFGAALALLTVPAVLQGQLNPGIHVARAADSFGGAFGIGASLELDIPLFPVDVMVAGEKFFPDCGTADGCSYQGATADLHFAMPFPVVQPYALGGVVYRRTDPGGAAAVRTDKGIGVGVGINLRALVMGAFAEARYEFVRDADDQWIARVGIRF